MFFHILAHKLAQHLGGGLILRPANLKERFAEIALNAYAQTNILHSGGVYPVDTHMCSMKQQSYSDSRRKVSRSAMAA